MSVGEQGKFCGSLLCNRMLACQTPRHLSCKIPTRHKTFFHIGILLSNQQISLSLRTLFIHHHHSVLLGPLSGLQLLIQTGMDTLFSSAGNRLSPTLSPTLQLAACYSSKKAIFPNLKKKKRFPNQLLRRHDFTHAVAHKQ